MLNRSRVFIALVGAFLLTTTVHAGTPAPELDPSSLGTGIGLASAVILLLTHRRRKTHVRADVSPDPSDPS